MSADPAHDPSPLFDRIARRAARVGVIGLGYVGLPLCRAFAERGFPVTGFDIDPDKVDRLNAGGSYLDHVPGEAVRAMLDGGRFTASADFARLGEMDAVLICVPTPLTGDRRPDLRFVVSTAESVARSLRPGQLVVLESTTWPGTTDEVLRPILEAGGLASGRDVFLAYSPEREDPGNARYETVAIPKVVGADDPKSRDLAAAWITLMLFLNDSPFEHATTASSMRGPAIFHFPLCRMLSMIFDRIAAGEAPSYRPATA